MAHQLPTAVDDECDVDTVDAFLVKRHDEIVTELQQKFLEGVFRSLARYSLLLAHDFKRSAVGIKIQYLLYPQLWKTFALGQIVQRFILESAMPLPPLIRTYLLNRGISNEVIDRNGIEWSNNRIAIPVYDEYYKFLFNKYRRSPLVAEGPKYTYDKGATTQLYHSAALIGPNPLTIICEGELDALVLEKNGYPAVTSTGGSQSFRKEWADKFKGKTVYICMDTDEAGIRGACLIQSIIPHAAIVTLPLKEYEGKDVTDFFLCHSNVEFIDAMNRAMRFYIPQDLEWVVDSPFSKAQAKEKMEEFSEFLDELVKTRRDVENRGERLPHIPFLVDYCNERIEHYRSFIANKLDTKISSGDDRVSAAKKVPIASLLPFNAAGFTQCLWHSEQTASLKYYKKDNHAFCFGCRKYADAIDIVMQLKNLSFKEALRELVP